MKICDLLKDSGKTFSFEFFPPKTRADTRQLYRAVKALVPLRPAFVSITHSSTGIAPYRTVALSSLIKHRIGVETMAHLTCISHSRREIKVITKKLRRLNVNNILALRGDIPSIRGVELLSFKSDYTHAGELVSHLKRLGDFCIGVAGYPECHPESSSPKEDILMLKQKVDAGASFIITQLFFDNKSYFKFVKDCRKAGILVPIIPGIMPVTNYRQIQRFTKMCGASIPPKMLKKLKSIKDDEKTTQSYGIDYALNQCRELLRKGAPGIHFYTLNHSKSTREILSRLRKTNDPIVRLAEE